MWNQTGSRNRKTIFGNRKTQGKLDLKTHGTHKKLNKTHRQVHGMIYVIYSCQHTSDSRETHSFQHKDMVSAKNTFTQSDRTTDTDS